MRTHGGATVHGAALLYEPPPYTVRETEQATEKTVVARKAAEYLRDGDMVILNAGTTMQALAVELRRYKGLQVVTNGLTVATALAASPGVQVFMIGGNVDFKKLGTVGSRAEEAMRDIRVEKAFLGITGISVGHGLFMHNAAEAEINRLFVSSAREVTVVVDSSKFDVPCLFRVAGLGEIHRLITDSGIRAEVRETLEKMDLDLDVVEAPAAA